MAELKKIELQAKKEALEMQLERICCEIADVKDQLHEVTKTLIEEQSAKERIDPHIEGIQRFVSLIDTVKLEDLQVMRLGNYMREIEDQLPYKYSSYFDTKKYILGEINNVDFFIVHVSDNKYRKLKWREIPDDLFDWDAMYYVVLNTRW